MIWFSNGFIWQTSLLLQLLSYLLVTFIDSFIVSISSSKSHWGDWFSRSCPRERWIGEIYFCENRLAVSVLRAPWRGRWFLRGPQVSTVGLTVCSKFLGLQTFGSFKGFNWMGRVLKLGKISSYFFKLSVREKDSSLNVLKISPGCLFFISH